jgi:hypothetical protein
LWLAGKLNSSFGWASFAAPSQAVMVLEDPPYLALGHKADTCAFFESIGIDQSFWWVN